MAYKTIDEERAHRARYRASGRLKEVSDKWRKNPAGKECDCGEPAIHMKSNKPVCARCQRIQDWLKEVDINNMRCL